jgi:hypothetical protein
MLTLFKPIDSNCISYLNNNCNLLDYIEFFNSKVQCINDGMYYAIINGGCYIIKPSAIMGNYSLILYSYPIKCDDSIVKELFNKGVGLRSCKIEGTKDNFGVEYIYNTSNFIELKGSDYRRHRNIINNIKTKFTIGNNNDVADIVQNWSENKKAKHQLKLYRTILKNLNLVHITTTYYNNYPIGFSVIEKINEKYGIILQRLINPIIQAYETKEPNYLLHYNDCIQFPNMLLNMGGCVGIKNMEIAKQKLIPEYKQIIYRQKSDTKITKQQYNIFKYGSENME